MYFFSLSHSDLPAGAATLRLNGPAAPAVAPSGTHSVDKRRRKSLLKC